ncbi:MAG: hypothetical protein Q4B91_00715 [Atopobiaceae bacterium]|nr:hypothetical protein [Atopobiaceae bacterium]
MRRVMRGEGLAAARPRRRRHGPYAGGEGLRAAPSLPLADEARGLRDLSAGRPGEVPVADVTELGLPDGARRVRPSPRVDPCDGDVGALSAGAGPSRALVAEMLEGAVAATGGGLTPHSDRGWCHRAPDRVAACGAAAAARSMSRRGRSPGNAAAGGLFGRLRVELLHGRDWSGVTAGELVGELSGYIRRYGEGGLKAFGEGGGTVYDTIRGRRERLGLAA